MATAPHAGDSRDPADRRRRIDSRRQFLPGIYWLTVFGPELAAAQDFSGLAQLPVMVTTLSHGARTVQIDEPVIAADMAKRLQLEARIADALASS